MAGLCEGGNEPSGSLKAICKLKKLFTSNQLLTKCLVSFRLNSILFRQSLMLAGSEFQSLGRAIVKEDEYEKVRWDGFCDRVAKLVAENNKPFSDGEFAKDLIVTVAEEVCPSMINSFKTLSLGRTAIVSRIAEMDSDIEDQLRSMIKGLTWYALALDECTDIKHTAQLAIFLRGVDDELNVFEEFLDLVPIKGHTSGEDIFEALHMVACKHELSWEKLVSLTTDGAPSMIGNSRGLMGQFYAFLNEIGIPRNSVKMIHCIIHREAPCAKSANLANVIQTKEAPLNCQLEIIDMQNNTRIRSSGKLGIELWRLIDRDVYPNLKNLVSRMLAMFGGTYVCEQFFSVMNNNKNNRRSRISDSNLVATLRVSVSKLQPDIDRLVAAKTSKSPPEKTE
ncbi:hypothetical protein ANN_16251 [Periplaneta americana]|uniref:Uncharacterized protein n=1 Tax=Periplaneta americana TaxID=6978 RepID=A0ABQ8SIJ7_PERAM|nr:hypothetical protein ANN_16251 [Periplaneta americana]